MTRTKKQNNDITIYQEKPEKKEETDIQTIEIPLRDAIYLRQALARGNYGGQHQLANFFKDLLGSGNEEIIDSRDAITMLSVGSVFAMACALILMMAFQTVFFKRLLLLH
ncbi:MAG: hypothetical protein CMO44_13100 [Verrucomicrobiales bacterium]|nr:hypothetical protein [Verrucomicrobiales bacterium]|tara:strand:- start:29355 stop:29684 length:330 start_codon:yes stop_codon:yes gene_type:complete